eukprot:TRINITY_DN3187_c0_g4_i1.p2 TRINITY_DN3187_c0_g4~~TRINITY_DN3187_c0_g4_i1.p2  ORF type:complete len:210 (-),score=24.93 TRINITY_DN3187_c0_g4_i1:225-770(-)
MEESLFQAEAVSAVASELVELGNALPRVVANAVIRAAVRGNIVAAAKTFSSAATSQVEGEMFVSALVKISSNSKRNGDCRAVAQTISEAIRSGNASVAQAVSSAEPLPKCLIPPPTVTCKEPGFRQCIGKIQRCCLKLMLIGNKCKSNVVGQFRFAGICQDGDARVKLQPLWVGLPCYCPL